MKSIKIALGISVFALAVCLVTLPASAAGKAAPKATGDYGYIFGGLKRYAQFEAQQTGNTCTAAVNLSGSYVFSLYGGTYTHDIVLTQTGSTLSGTGGYPAGASSYLDTESIAGSVTGNTFTFTSTYQPGSIGYPYSYTVNGTVDPITGALTVTSWSGGIGSDWTVTGNAQTVTGCNGRGSFTYSDVNGTTYTIAVRYVSVDSVNGVAYFAGPIVSGNFGNSSQWLYVQVVDNGEPGVGHDVTSGDYPLTQAQALYDVATHATPSSQATINSGNIQVH